MRDKKEKLILKKNDEIELEIIDNGINLEGIAREENKVVFIPGAIPTGVFCLRK